MNSSSKRDPLHSDLIDTRGVRRSTPASERVAGSDTPVSDMQRFGRPFQDHDDATEARYKETLNSIRKAIVQDEHFSYTSVVRRSLDREAFDRDIARLLPGRLQQPDPMEKARVPSNPNTVYTPRHLGDAYSIEPRASQVISRRPRPVEFDGERQRHDHPRDFTPGGSLEAQFTPSRAKHRLVWIGVIAFLAVFLLGSYSQIDLSSESIRLSQATTALSQVLSRVASRATKLLPSKFGQHLNWSKAPSQRLLTTDLTGATNLPIALGVSVRSPPIGGHILIHGLPSGGRLTTGVATGDGSWRVQVGDLARTAVIPPYRYVGPMDLGVDLRLSDGTVVDSAVLRLEWTAATGDMIIPKSAKTTAVPAPGLAFPPPAPQR